jgi:hypothetical protein
LLYRLRQCGDWLALLIGKALAFDAPPAAQCLLTVLRKGTKHGLIDQPIWIARKTGVPLALRLVAVKKLLEAAEAARRKARREAVKGRHQISKARSSLWNGSFS